MFDNQTIDLLPARTTMKRGGRGGRGGNGGRGGDAVNIAVVKVDVDGNNNDVRVDIDQEATGGDGGAGGAGG